MAHALTTFLDETKSAPFVWGKCDCALWAADFVKICTGIDPAHKLRGTYSSAFACERLLKWRGGLEAVSSDLMQGYEPGSDVVLVEHEGRLALGLKSGSGVAIKDQVGWSVLVDPQVIKGWRVWSQL